MAAEGIVEFRKGHVTDQHRQRHNAHHRFTAYDKRRVCKLIDVDLMVPASSIIANRTVCKWMSADGSGRTLTMFAHGQCS